MTVATNKNVLWLQISVYDPSLMKAIDALNNFRSIEPRGILRQAFPRPRLQCTEKFPAHAIFHAEVQILLRLE